MKDEERDGCPDFSPQKFIFFSFAFQSLPPLLHHTHAMHSKMRFGAHHVAQCVSAAIRSNLQKRAFSSARLSSSLSKSLFSPAASAK